MRTHYNRPEKYSLQARVQRGVQEAMLSPDLEALSKKLATAIKNGTLPTDAEAQELTRKMQIVTSPYENGISATDAVPGGQPGEPGSGESKLRIRTNTVNLAYIAGYNFLRQWVMYSDEEARNQFKNIPPYGNPNRDLWLSEIWRHEPILAGGVYSMATKIASLKWSVSGPRLNAKRLALILSGMAFIDGYDWGGAVSSTAEDFYTTNRGSFWETPRIGDPMYGKLADIGHIDAMCCNLTGNVEYPMIYVSHVTGQVVKFGAGEYAHFSSLPSARERNLGAGFCAVDRAFRAAQLLMGLHDYDLEKLDNMPPEGVASVTGLTMDEFQDALVLWQAERRKNNSVTFPQILWLISSQPNAKVGVELTGFSQLPEEFNRATVVEQYINTLALAFGVDAREFWTMAGGSGDRPSAGESEIQHMKAKGKGHSELVTRMERMINGEAGDDIYFEFDALDAQEEADSAKIAKAWVDAYMPLYNLKPAGGPSQFGGGVFKANPKPELSNGEPSSPTTPLPGADTGGNMSSNAGGAKLAEQVITKDQLIRMLVDHRVLPEWLAFDQRTLITDDDVHTRRLTQLKSDDDSRDITKFVWNKGVLSEERMPAIILNSPSWFDEEFVEAEFVDTSKNESKDVKVDDSSLVNFMKFLHLKEEQILGGKRNIRGNPIPEAEVTRGSSVNRAAIHLELERWRANVKLAPYAPTPEEENKLFGAYKKEMSNVIS